MMSRLCNRLIFCQLSSSCLHYNGNFFSYAAIHKSIIRKTTGFKTRYSRDLIPKALSEYDEASFNIPKKEIAYRKVGRSRKAILDENIFLEDYFF